MIPSTLWSESMPGHLAARMPLHQTVSKARSLLIGRARSSRHRVVRAVNHDIAIIEKRRHILRYDLYVTR